MNAPSDRRDPAAPEPFEANPLRPPAAGPVQTYLLPVYRSRWIAAACIGIGALAGLAAGVIQPNEYTSVGKMLVRIGERERIQPDAIDETSGGAGSQVLSNELHLLGNEAIYKRVAERVGAARILAPYDPVGRYGDSESAPHVAFLHRLQSRYFREKEPSHTCTGETCADCLFEAQHVLLSPARTQVSVAPRSNVIVIRHTSHDGPLAKQVVDALISEFDLRHQEIYTARGAVQLLKRRQEEAVREAGEADRELMRIREELGLHDIASERQRLLETMYSLDHEIAALALDIKLAERRLAHLETQLAELVPIDEPIAEYRWEPNPAYQRQQQVVEGLIRKRAELLSTFTADTTPVKNVDADIAREDEKLSGIMPLVRVESFRVPGNEEHTRLTQAVSDTRTELAALGTRKAEKDATRAGVSERLRTIRENEPRLADLAMRAQILRKAAEEATAVLESKRMLEALDEARISNLVVLDWGTYPRKSGPDRKKILLIGIFAGFAAGIAVAFLRSTLDGRIHAPAELEAAAGTVVLAAIRRRRGLPAERRRP